MDTEKAIDVEAVRAEWRRLGGKASFPSFLDGPERTSAWDFLDTIAAQKDGSGWTLYLDAKDPAEPTTLYTTVDVLAALPELARVWGLTQASDLELEAKQCRIAWEG